MNRYVCVDDDGVRFVDHDWSEWIDRPVHMEPASEPHHPVRLRHCFRCNKYEGKRLGEIEQIGAKGD